MKKLVILLVVSLAVFPVSGASQNGDEYVRVFGVGASEIDPLDPATYAEPLAMLQTLPTQLFTNQVTVTTAGTRVQLSAASRPITGVVVRALNANGAGFVYVGKSTVTAANGYELGANESVSVPLNNLNLIWVDADTNGMKISYLAVAL